VENGGAEFDLIPAQVAQFRRSQPVPEGDEDHRGVPVPMPVRFGCFDEGLDLARRQVFSGAEFGVRTSCRDNCSIYLVTNSRKVGMTMPSQTVALLRRARRQRLRHGAL
jgi:hypothetical protein